MGSLKQHNSLVELLAKDLRQVYPDCDIISFYVLKEGKKQVGETDIFLETETDIHLFEIKSGRYTQKRKQKAFRQLEKFARKLHPYKPTLLYYVFPLGESFHAYMREWSG